MANFEYSGYVERVEQKTVSNGGTLFKLTINTDDGVKKPSTFDERAAGLQGKTINFNMTQNGKFWNLKDFEITQPKAPATTTNSNDTEAKRNAMITASALVKSGFDAGVIKDMASARLEFAKCFVIGLLLFKGDKDRVIQLIENDQLEAVAEAAFRASMEDDQGEGE
jgi:hypothetical protein